MSSYTTQAAIQGEIRLNELIQLTDDDKTGSVNATILAQVIANASGEIDSRVANIYGNQLPFNPIPSSVASMALTIACYRLYRRAMIPDEKNKYYAAYQDVIDFLERVNKGDAMLDDVISRDFASVVYTGQRSIYGSMGSNFPARSL